MCGRGDRGLAVGNLEAKKGNEKEGRHVGEVVSFQVQVRGHPHDRSILLTDQLHLFNIEPRPPRVPEIDLQAYIEDDLVEELHRVAAEHQR